MILIEILMFCKYNESCEENATLFIRKKENPKFTIKSAGSVIIIPYKVQNIFKLFKFIKRKNLKIICTKYF